MATAQEPGNKADQILSRLGEVLQEVDIDIVTINQITNKLAEELGSDVYDYKALIKERINKFTAAVAASEEPAPEPTNKRKREAGDEDDDEGAEAPKISKAADAGGEFAVALSNTRQVRVSEFKGTLYVSIREWYDKAGTQAPGKGIHLPVTQWNELTANLDATQAAVADSETNYLCKLSQNKQLSLKQFKGKLQVDIREMYEKDGELLPGKKGIALDETQWNKLVQAIPAIEAAIQDHGSTQATAQKDLTTAEAGPSTAGAGPDRSQAGPSTAGAKGATAEESTGLPIQLSAFRRADVSDYRGTHYVNIREYYESDGKLLPGKKGISLPSDQFLKLFEAHLQLTDALAAKDEECNVHLSGKRKANISVFKGKPMVNIREYYEQDGKEKPGKKGISLPAEQWHKLAAGFALLNAELERQAEYEI